MSAEVCSAELGGGEILTPDIVVWVHPINPKEHPTYRPGYRWAVHYGSLAASDLRYCCNAGRCDTLFDAKLMGESHGAAACRALRFAGVAARYSMCVLAWDPIPAEADDKPFRVWTGELQKGD